MISVGWAAHSKEYVNAHEATSVMRYRIPQSITLAVCPKAAKGREGRWIVCRAYSAEVALATKAGSLAQARRHFSTLPYRISRY